MKTFKEFLTEQQLEEAKVAVAEEHLPAHHKEAISTLKHIGVHPTGGHTSSDTQHASVMHSTKEHFHIMNDHLAKHGFNQTSKHTWSKGKTTVASSPKGSTVVTTQHGE